VNHSPVDSFRARIHGDSASRIVITMLSLCLRSMSTVCSQYITSPLRHAMTIHCEKNVVYELSNVISRIEREWESGLSLG
jgi:hypothetical protein